MEKKKYLKPAMNLVLFEDSDVIVTSGGEDNQEDD